MGCLTPAVTAAAEQGWRGPREQAGRGPESKEHGIVGRTVWHVGTEDRRRWEESLLVVLVEITRGCWQGQKTPVVSGQTKENMSTYLESDRSKAQES